MGGRGFLRWAATLTVSVTAGVLLAAQPAPAEVPASVTAAFDAVTGQARYANSTWGWDVVDMATGESLYRRNANEQFVPGSIIKDYAAAAVLQALGPDYRFRTPVHALGRVRRGVLRGDLALVGTGDFSFGLRNRPDDTLAFTDFDHNEAGTLPFAQQLEGVDPLAGVRQLARAVRRSGIRRVSGDVIVDNRLVHAVLRLAGRADRLDLGQREPDRHLGLPVVPGPARQGPLAAAHRGLPRRQPGEDDGPGGDTRSPSMTPATASSR